MSNGKGSALSIIALLIGVVGMGAGGFSIYQNFSTEGLPGTDGINGIDGVNGTDGVDGLDGINGTSNVVAVWDQITGTGITFNVSLENEQVGTSGYFTLTDFYDSIILINQAGWYRFNIRFLWNSLSGSFSYVLSMYKNGVSIGVLEHVNSPALTTYRVTTFMYIYSDGNDFFSIFSECTGASGHSIYSLDQSWNQIALEYVGE